MYAIHVVFGPFKIFPKKKLLDSQTGYKTHVKKKKKMCVLSPKPVQCWKQLNGKFRCVIELVDYGFQRSRVGGRIAA